MADTEYVEIDAMGWITHISYSADGRPHRTTYPPGVWVDGSWIEADLSTAPDAVVAEAAKLWTPEFVEEYKNNNAWVPPPPPPPPPTPEEKLAAAGLTQDEFDALVAAAIARQQG